VPSAKKAFALAPHEKLVRSLIAAEPDLTLTELQARLADEAIVVGRTSIWSRSAAAHAVPRPTTLR
jgi:hypothetical protein